VQLAKCAGSDGRILVRLRQLLARCMLICMQSTSVRVSGDTHAALKQLAAELGMTVGDTVDLAVRRLTQNQMGRELTAPLDEEETRWLEADLS